MKVENDVIPTSPNFPLPRLVECRMIIECMDDDGFPPGWQIVCIYLKYFVLAFGLRVRVRVCTGVPSRLHVFLPHAQNSWDKLQIHSHACRNKVTGLPEITASESTALQLNLVSSNVFIPAHRCAQVLLGMYHEFMVITVNHHLLVFIHSMRCKSLQSRFSDSFCFFPTKTINFLTK